MEVVNVFVVVGVCGFIEVFSIVLYIGFFIYILSCIVFVVVIIVGLGV